ncbi:sugar transferase [Daejeonella sp. JGW-45]|uniref:sugar transferase n=1 Tax=Daejeonella sp. JGW-45 TaxID=3034148 RepID=UPI0023EAE623|nr:sugar transferase [Daejeonella sp. JGW-45]
MYLKYFKRIIDISASLLGIILLMPVLLVVALLLMFVNKGNPLFLQKRVGKNHSLFQIIKFKTMSDKRDQFGDPLPDHERMTKLGQWIRRYSLDEIPQLFNVFWGDMSLIGPRPLLEEYLPLYNEYQKRRHLVRPGITGWAQVNGRNALLWTQKFQLDVWYVDHISLGLDFKILMMTFIKVFKSEGVSHNGHITMSKFEGNDI